MVEKRKQFGSSLQFILSCVGYAVGLGNIWRFPMLAYENGGGSFMIPYLCCSFFIGFPMLYLELSIGQYFQSSAAVVFYKIRPYAQGIGWGMAIMSTLVSIYYNVIVAWTLVFIVSIIRGQSKQWAICGNEWNDIQKGGLFISLIGELLLDCLSSIQNKDCVADLNDTSAFYFNDTCHHSSELPQFRPLMLYNQSASSQFFENYVLQKTDTMENFGGINWSVFAALVVVWIITALALSKGVKLIGKLAYFTATVPYIIIAILFFRSITLPGARKGLDFYLLKINFNRIFVFQSWQKAATQVCYSLAIGFGGLLTLSSHNPKSHNCLRDALILTCADGFMSIFGGTAVFSVLGFMATQQKKEIDQVIRSGTGLAFIAYPEAMNQMPYVPWLWALLFFVMLFTLGVSSQFGLAEVMCTAICDQFPKLRKRMSLVVAAVCFMLFLGGVVMTTRAGIFYFKIFNDYSASFALCIIILLEIILVCYIYGIRNYIRDLASMFGYPKNICGKILGHTGIYFRIIWCFIAPICISVLLVFMLIDQSGNVPVYGKGQDQYIFPSWSMAYGWILSVLPLIAIPVTLIANIIHLRIQNKPLKNLAISTFKNADLEESSSRSSAENSIELPLTSSNLSNKNSATKALEDR